MTVPTANTSPIWSAVPDFGGVVIGQASTNVNSDTAGTIGTNTFVAFSTGTDGAYLQRIRFYFASTTSAINSVATCFNVYISSVSTGSPTSSEAILYQTFQAAAQTITTTTPPFPLEFALNFPLPTNRHILVGQTVAQSANSNWKALVIASDY